MKNKMILCAFYFPIKKLVKTRFCWGSISGNKKYNTTNVFIKIASNNTLIILVGYMNLLN